MGERPPWHDPAFSDWQIARLFHYDQPGEQDGFLFVRMKNSDGREITGCGPDDDHLWQRLAWAAETVEMEEEEQEDEIISAFDKSWKPMSTRSE